MALRVCVSPNPLLCPTLFYPTLLCPRPSLPLTQRLCPPHASVSHSGPAPAHQTPPGAAVVRASVFELPSRTLPSPSRRARPDLQVDQLAEFAAVDVAGNLDYKALSCVLTHQEEKE